MKSSTQYSDNLGY